MSGRILFVGDIHLGRAPSHIPEALRSQAANLGTSAAWRAVAEYAVTTQLDAVVLAGDVVESDNAAIEAFGHLETGVRRMAAAGVAVYAVAGNHDVVALPRLATEMPEGFHLLGRGGTWDIVSLHHRREPFAHLIGWSFPQRAVKGNPLDSGFPPTPSDGLPIFGVLHCDLDASNSSYAPVTRASLERTGLSAWFLGHIHKPDQLAVARPLGYCGSLVGLDPTETGLHAPWLVTLDAEGMRVEQVPLSPLRWETEDLPVGREDVEPTIEGLMIAGVDRVHARVQTTRGDTRVVGCRMRLVGATPQHAALRVACAAAQNSAMQFESDGITYFIDRVEDAARPALALESLATARDPAGALARRLLYLERRAPESEVLLRAARAALERTAHTKVWQSLDPPDLSDETLRATLLDAGYEALEALLAQTASSGSPTA